jgi:hypothetical protein
MRPCGTENQPAICSHPVLSLNGFERTFAGGERELLLLKALKGAIIAANRSNPTHVSYQHVPQ